MGKVRQITLRETLFAGDQYGLSARPEYFDRIRLAVGELDSAYTIRVTYLTPRGARRLGEWLIKAAEQIEEERKK